MLKLVSHLKSATLCHFSSLMLIMNKQDFTREPAESCGSTMYARTSISVQPGSYENVNHNLVSELGFFPM